MATITTSSLGELLKRLYASWEIEQLVNLTYPALEHCARKGSAQLGGSGFYFPVRTESAHGHAYIGESADLPAGRQTTVKQAVVSPTVHAGVVQLTGLSMAISSGNAMAFARSFDENVQQTIEAMSAYKEGALFRDGSGLLATQTDTATGVITAGTAIEMSDVSFFREGMYVDHIDATATTRHNLDLQVTEVDWVNKTVKFDANTAGSGVGNRLFISDSQADTGALDTDIEPIGLEGALLATGTYLGISRSSDPNWQSNVLAANSFFDEDILLRARTRITQESGVTLQRMARSFKAVSHPMQQDVLFKLAIPRIRYSGNENFDLGNSDNLKFGGIPFVTSYQCPAGTAYLGDWKHNVSLYTPNGELHIDTEYNGSSLKWVATKDVGLVFVKEYCAFANKKPNCFARITDLTQPSR
jgi:hypothetical protein